MMKQYAILGRVFADYVLYENGAVIIEGEKIVAVGDRDTLSLPADVVDCGDRLVLPGFVDIHCHGYPGGRCHISAEIFADYHLKHGTTGVLGSLYRTLSHAETLDAIELIRDAMGKYKSRCWKRPGKRSSLKKSQKTGGACPCLFLVL